MGVSCKDQSHTFLGWESIIHKAATHTMYGARFKRIQLSKCPMAQNRNLLGCQKLLSADCRSGTSQRREEKNKVTGTVLFPMVLEGADTGNLI